MAQRPPETGRRAIEPEGPEARAPDGHGVPDTHPPTQRVASRRVERPNGGRPQGRGEGPKPENVGPKGGRPFNVFFTLLPQSFFSSLSGCLLTELWSPSPEVRVLGFSGSQFVRAPPAYMPAGGASKKDPREPKRALQVVHGLELRPQFHEKTTREKKRRTFAAGEGKSAKTWAVRRRAVQERSCPGEEVRRRGGPAAAEPERPRDLETRRPGDPESRRRSWGLLRYGPTLAKPLKGEKSKHGQTRSPNSIMLKSCKAFISSIRKIGNFKKPPKTRGELEVPMEAAIPCKIGTKKL